MIGDDFDKKFIKPILDPTRQIFEPRPETTDRLGQLALPREGTAAAATDAPLHVLTDAQERMFANPPRREVVNVYMSVLESALGYQTIDGDPAQNGDVRGLLVGRLRSARIFQFSAIDYARWRRLADVYATECLSGHKWAAAKLDQATGQQVPTRIVPQNEQDDYVRNLAAAVGRFGFFSRLPFDACWIAWGVGNITADVPVWRGGVERIGQRQILGHLVTTDADGDGYVIEARRRVDPSDGKTFVEFFWAFHDGHWSNPSDLTPWILGAALGAIEDAGTALVSERAKLSDRLAFEKMRKLTRTKLPPPAYYRVPVRAETIDFQATTRDLSRRRRGPLSYRFDVRGHWVTWFQRGTIGDAEAIESVRRRRGKNGERYVFYSAINPVSPDVWRIFVVHGQDIPALGEWVAVLRTWRGSFKKGPAGAPYVPAVRRVEQ